MKASVVSLDYVDSLPASGPNSGPNSASWINVFGLFGTEGCLLDCQIWHARQAWILSKNATHAAEILKRDRILEKGRERLTFIMKRRRAQQPNHQCIITTNMLMHLKLEPRDPFTAKDLEASSENGCGSCRLLKTLIDCLLSPRTDLVRDAVVFEWMRFDFTLKVEDENSRMHYFQLFNPLGATQRVHGMRRSNILCGDTSSTKSLNQASQWIQECEISHAQCGRGRNVSLPKRLIDLEPRDSPNGPGVRLVETEGMTGTYACLSHCWGKDPMPVRTTMRTESDHLKFILWSSLPKTFRDAGIMARRLGLRYIWIDSLCIIQDSTADWEIEAGKMADVYHNGFITIAAVSSSDFRGGCFSPEKTPPDLCLRLEADGLDTFVAIRDCEKMGIIHDMESYQQAYPLFTRSWVFQERMLSRRILLCNHRELQFECRESQHCECGAPWMTPHLVPGSYMVRGVAQKGEYAKLEKSHKRFSGRNEPTWKDATQRHWQQMVVHYSKLGLTNPDDKLPALSGCAIDVGRLTGDKYYAGIWRSGFARSMIWSVLEPMESLRPAVWRAPSWSWASVEAAAGLVYTYVKRSSRMHAFQERILEVKCEPVRDVSPMGAIKRGALVRIRSPLVPAHLRRICRTCLSGREALRYTIEHGRSYSVSARSSCIEPCKFDVSGLDFGSGARVELSSDYKYDEVDFDFFDAEKVDIGGEIPGRRVCRLARVFLMHVFETANSPSGPVTDYYLVLKRMERGSPVVEEFERVGLFSTTLGSREQRDSWYEHVYPGLIGEEKIVTIV